MDIRNKGSKRVEISGLGDKRQITAVLCGLLVGDFLPIQLVYKGKTQIGAIQNSLFLLGGMSHMHPTIGLRSRR